MKTLETIKSKIANLIAFVKNNYATIISIIASVKNIQPYLLKVFEKLTPKSKKIGKYTITFLLTVLGAVGCYFLLHYIIGPYESMSRYPAAFMLMFFGVAAWMFFDRIYFSEINTIDALKSGNIAYALMMLSISLIISAVIVII